MTLEDKIKRDKLVGMMAEAMEPCDNCANCQECSYFPVQPCSDYLVADYMLAHGVTIKGVENDTVETVTNRNGFGEWRPVSELPKRNGETVLVYFEYFRYGEYNRLFRSIGLGYALDGQWTRFINGESGWHRLKILAWMPLPKEPKGE